MTNYIGELAFVLDVVILVWWRGGRLAASDLWEGIGFHSAKYGRPSCGPGCVYDGGEGMRG